MQKQAIQSLNQCESPLEWHCMAGAIQTSYDIVKAHGGELRLETKENEGSEFVVELSLNISSKL
jgi:hypothetical protein